MQPRPISATIFGILNIGFGMFGLLGLVFMHAMSAIGDKLAAASPAYKAVQNDPNYMHWLAVSSSISGVASLFLIAAGAGLLVCQNWARIVSIGWAIFDILFILGTMPLTIKYTSMALRMTNAGAQAAQLQESLVIFSTVFGMAFSLAYPIVLLVFMTRRKLAEACKPRSN